MYQLILEVKNEKEMNLPYNQPEKGLERLKYQQDVLDLPVYF